MRDRSNALMTCAALLSDLQKIPSEEKEDTDLPPLWNHVVPAPFTSASNHPCSSSTAKPEVTSKQNLHSKPLLNASSQPSENKHEIPAAPPLPLEVNAAILPLTKPRHFFMKTTEGPLPRGPLSYDALVYLRKSTSTKKTPLCPTVDHTIDSGNEPPVAVEGLKLGSSRPRSQAGAAKCPPALPPKPKILLTQASVETENKAPIPSDSSYSLKHVTDPEVVRLEALQKLGLLKEEEAERDTLGPLPPCRSHSLLHPPRNPSFSPSQVHSESKSRCVRSRCEQQPCSVPQQFQTDEGAATGLQLSASQQNHKTVGPCPEERPCTDSGSVKSTPAAPPAVPPKPQSTSNAVGYSVMVVPGMGADRKEALRKLGLLKN